MTFNSLYKLKNQVKTESDNENLFALSAKDGKKGVVGIANTNPYPVKISLELKNCAFTDVEVLRIDEENRYTMTGETLETGEILIPAEGCIEIKLFDMK